jgi:predicted DNA-binding protein (MmcQ/YjbR family)
MRFDRVRDYLLSLPGAAEDFPFGPENMVFRVGGKIFAILAYEETPARVNLKCEPSRALELRESFASVIPGYHMNKQHWNTVILDGELSDRQIKELADHSYAVVEASLSKSRRPRKASG